ncbi:MAG: hypothetical protein GTO02_19110, partial [Candidatus Dadabacteria bacterium]|nr:hypothetical protein [Candidatus Dadabacteria bacterium]
MTYNNTNINKNKNNNNTGVSEIPYTEEETKLFESIWELYVKTQQAIDPSATRASCGSKAQGYTAFLSAYKRTPKGLTGGKIENFHKLVCKGLRRIFMNCKRRETHSGEKTYSKIFIPRLPH